MNRNPFKKRNSKRPYTRARFADRGLTNDRYSSAKRREIARARRLKKKEQTPKVREVVRSSPLQFEVFLHTYDKTRRKIVHDNELILSFIRETISGRFKFKYSSVIYRGKKTKVASSILLEDDSDVFMIMMCHKDQVRKIFKYVSEK